MGLGKKPYKSELVKRKANDRMHSGTSVVNNAEVRDKPFIGLGPKLGNIGLLVVLQKF